MTPAALALFNTKRLDTQYALYGGTATYQAATINVCMSAVRSRKQLTDGGFELLHSFIARVRISEVPTPPLLESKLIVSGKTYVIGEVVASLLGGEWVLGLRAV